jgi:hypothetical protein
MAASHSGDARYRLGHNGEQRAVPTSRSPGLIKQKLNHSEHKHKFNEMPVKIRNIISL